MVGRHYYLGTARTHTFLMPAYHHHYWYDFLRLIQQNDPYSENFGDLSAYGWCYEEDLQEGMEKFLSIIGIDTAKSAGNQTRKHL